MQLRAWLVVGVGMALLAAGCGPTDSVTPDASVPHTEPLGPSCLDNDADGVPGTGTCMETSAVDCDDADPLRAPGFPEQCNGRDDDCDGEKDEGLEFRSLYVDADGDGLGGAQVGTSCATEPPDGMTFVAGDCDDQAADVHPGAAERCNGVDEDCNGQVDDGLLFQVFRPDEDGDGFGATGAPGERSCLPFIPGKVSQGGDCDDGNATVKPGATEQCNKVDEDCDGTADDGIPFTSYYVDHDGDGFGLAGTGQSDCAPIPGRVTNAQDCDDSNPSRKPDAPELCNGVDDDCDGQVDENQKFLSYVPDADGDGFGAAGATPVLSCLPVAGRVTNTQDCDDSNPAVKPTASERCNGEDDDCDGAVDDGLTFLGYYPDADGDGYGASGSTPVQACAQLPGRVTNAQDCDDTRSLARPGASEFCNGADDDCDGSVDEGNPGGGAACSTGELGVCAPGTRTCQGGNLVCVHTVGPSAERCDGLDNDCDGQADETFTDKGQSCQVGQGVCRASGVQVCRADGTGTQCNATLLPPTPPACDGLDNDCDGVVDEPALVSTLDVGNLPWTDLELAPLYHSASSCGGGVTGSGTDALVGAGLVMAGGRSEVMFQRLDVNGAPLDAPVSVTALTYSDVAMVQAQDGYIIAGVWGSVPELDFYYVDSAGTRRAQLWTQFRAASGNTLDSLRLVRGNGKRVTVLWRESNVGIKLAQLEPVLDGTTWRLQKPGGGAPSATVILSGNVAPGLGVDSTHADWGNSQTCVSASSLRTLGLAYLPTAQELRQLTVAENGTAMSGETVIRIEQGAKSLREPEVAFFQSNGDQWFVAYTTEDAGNTPDEDLNYWLSTDPAWHYAWLAFAKVHGTDSIRRPRASVTADRLWLGALRDVEEASGFTRQVMTRTLDFTGARIPTSQAVEIPVTSGGCEGRQASCRPGNKDGFTPWARAGRVYFSADGATPAGSFASTLSCQ